MISIIANSTSLSPLVNAPLSAVNGVPPYVWAVMGGGAGGTIDAATGAYRAPQTYGSDTIQVTDSLSNTAEIVLNTNTPIQLVCDIIATEMNLGADQVWQYNAKVNIPIDSALYVVVGQLSCKPFSNNKTYAVVDGVYSQIQSTNFQTQLSIDIMSRGSIARDQKELVILALGSTYAESQMELNSFQIALQPTSMVNLSEVDGAAIPYRFNIAANIQYFVKTITPVPYFSSFSDVAILPDNT